MPERNFTKEIDVCIELLDRRELTADSLRSLVMANKTLCQDVLYIQTVFSLVPSLVNGMAVISDGVVQEMPEDPEDWTYSSVLEAMNDGWRIIRFPNMALMMDDLLTTVWVTSLSWKGSGTDDHLRLQTDTDRFADG